MFTPPPPEVPLARDLGKLKKSFREKRSRILEKVASSQSKVAPEPEATTPTAEKTPVPKPSPRLWRRAQTEGSSGPPKTKSNKKTNKKFHRSGSWGGVGLWGKNRDASKTSKGTSKAANDLSTSPPASAPMLPTGSCASSQADDEDDDEAKVDQLTKEIVQESWQVLYTRDGIESELGNLALSHMQQQDSETISKLRLTLVSENNVSQDTAQDQQEEETGKNEKLPPPPLELLDDERYSEVCTILVELVDMIVTVFLDTPRLSDFDEELLELGVRSSQEGLDVTKMSDALLFSFGRILGRQMWTDEVQFAWKEILEKVMPKMIVPKHHWILLSY